MLVLAADPQAHPTRDQHGQSRTSGEQVGDEGSGLDDVLEVVEHEQVAPVSEDRLDPIRERLGARLARAHGLADGRGDEGGIRDRRKRDEQHAIRKG